MRAGLGDSILESLEKAIYLATSSDITSATATTGSEWGSERLASLGLAISSTLKGYTTTAAKITAALLSSAVKFTVQAVVSLVLGFMLVWDLPSITKGVSSLSSSRLAPVYHEVAPVLTVFGLLFGKALEVQARIAVVNTLLTAMGMWLLDIPGIGLQSLFVFVCSFIPIAGCVISTVPIGFVALTEYGFVRLLLVILMVFFVHFVEAYFLNPAIYSAHLKLHPLMVLSVLVVAEHSIGVLGLLMAVPLTCFLLDYCIRYPSKSLTETAKEELNIINTVVGSIDSMDGDELNEGSDEPPTIQYHRPSEPPPGSPTSK
jgi:predicted PurR-regulated permease PerM